MSYNPHSDDTISAAQPTEALPLMEELQPRLPQGYPANTPQPVQVTDQASLVPIEEIESAETRQEEALTIKFAIGKLNDYLGWFLVVLETLLAIRFFLMLIGADPNNLFASFIYALTNILVFPFMGIVGTPSLHRNQAFDFPTLIAGIIYYLLFWALRRFLHILISSPEEPVE